MAATIGSRCCDPTAAKVDPAEEERILGVALELTFEDSQMPRRETKAQGARVERLREDNRRANARCESTRFGRVDSAIVPPQGSSGQRYAGYMMWPRAEHGWVPAHVRGEKIALHSTPRG